jgi:hypothetical protein
VPERSERTRRVGGETDKQVIKPRAVPVPSPGVVAARHRAAAKIDEARTAYDAGDLNEAVAAAEAALTEADQAPAPGIVEVIEPARPLLANVFAAYVGPTGGIPVMAPRGSGLPRGGTSDGERAVLGRIDGMRTLGELFDGSGLGSIDALRIAARLIRSGAIRIV